MFARAEVVPEVWHRFDSPILLPVEDSVSWTDEYTVFSVVRDVCTDSSQCLWGFSQNDTLTLAVLTDGIYTPSAGILLSHSPRDFSRWCIYTYHSGIRLDSTKSLTLRLGQQTVSGKDSAATDILPANIEMAELAYFKGNVPRLPSASFLTYLALKYGITLDYAAYLSPSGDTLWHPTADETYYHRITGIGNDTLHNWYSNVAQSKADATLLLLADTLEVGEYVIAGDDGGDLSWHSCPEGGYCLQRSWRIRHYINHPKRLRVALRLSALSECADSLWLSQTDCNGTIGRTVLPDSVTGDSVGYFTLHTQDSVLHLQLRTNALQTKQPRNNKRYGSYEEKSSEAVIYDAQTNTIQVSGFPEGQVFELYLYDSTGKLCSTQLSQSPIDVGSLPQTVFHIGITSSGKTIGAISLPAMIH